MMGATPPKDEDGADASSTNVQNCTENGLLTGTDSRILALEMIGQRSQNTAMST